MEDVEDASGRGALPEGAECHSCPLKSRTVLFILTNSASAVVPFRVWVWVGGCWSRRDVFTDARLKVGFGDVALLLLKVGVD